MWAEGVLGRNGGWGVGVRAQTGSLVQLMALTEAGLWPYRGESWRGKGGERVGRRGLSAHWGLLSARQPPAYGQSIRTHWRKKIDFHWKKKTGWKSTSHSVCEQVFQTLMCVTPPLTSDIVKCLSAHLAHCIYDEPEVMIDSPVPIYSYWVHVCA